MGLWYSPGSNSCAHFIIKGYGASRVFPATDVSYIRHKIMLTLCVTTSTLLVEQGFAGFSTAVRRSVATLRQPLRTMQFPRSSGFDSPPFSGQTLAETRCLQEPAPCRRLPQAPPCSAPAQYSFPAWRSCRNAPPGPGRLRGRTRTVNSAVFHNASLNAHIEWRFP